MMAYVSAKLSGSITDIYTWQKGEEEEEGRRHMPLPHGSHAPVERARAFHHATTIYLTYNATITLLCSAHEDSLAVP